MHVRDYTKGHPTIESNNHPIRHGSVVGIHNGIIVNDEEIFARYGFERAHPDMTVDSEAIFALAEHAGGSPKALEELHGAMATAWLDERYGSDALRCPRGRPAALDRHRRQGALLRLHASCARPASRRRSGCACASASSTRARCFGSRTDASTAPTASSPTARTSRRRSSPRSGPRTRAPRACGASPRSPCATG